MTREEERSKAAYSQYCNSESICFNLMCDSFKQGAKWADEHPKSPWISVNEDLPCNHEELIFLGGLIDGSETIDVFVRYESGDIWCDYMICTNGKWRWSDGEPDYWMIPPKLPKRRK